MPSKPTPNSRRRDDSLLDHRLTHALSTAPASLIPEGFAARVAARAQSLPTLQIMPARPAPRYGRLAIYLSLPILLIAMLALARIAIPLNPITLTMQALASAEFVLLALYLALRPQPLR